MFSLSLPLWATLGDNCLVSVERDCNLKNKSDGTDFKMGVAATLPELSEWTLPHDPFKAVLAGPSIPDL